MEKQETETEMEMEMETEMEIEMEDLNGNSCTIVSNHWNGLLNLPILPLLVRAEAKRAYYLLLSLVRCLSLSQYRSRSCAYLISFNK